MYVFKVRTRIGDDRCERSVFLYFNLYGMNKVDKVDQNQHSEAKYTYGTANIYDVCFCNNFNVTKNHLESFSDILTILDTCKFAQQNATLDFESFLY